MSAPVTASFNLGIAQNPRYISPSTTSSRTGNIMGSSPESVVAAPALKPKQSKSRNGCVTCKAKRLKCDELKPTCHQCQKRGVSCGGYKKDFKWRPFEESALGGKAPKLSRKSNSNGVTKPKRNPPPPLGPNPTFPDATFIDSAGGPQQSPLESRFGSPSTSPYQMQFPSTPPQQFSHHSRQQRDDFMILPLQPSPIQIPPPQTTAPLFAHTPQFRIVFPLSTPGNAPILLDNGSGPTSLDSRLPQPQNSMHSMHSFPPEASEPIYHQHSNTLSTLSIPTIVKEEVEDDDIEEIIRESPNTQEFWFSCPSPSPSNASAHSSSSQSSYESVASGYDIPSRPYFGIDSAEMLLLHFDKNTCGIMSVKDGPTENPWRTLIWPLAKGSPALYYAIASMTAFHMSRDQPELRLKGIEHMHSSVNHLREAFEYGTIGNDAALATTLVLAFSEAFDQHTSSGTQHLRGAKGFVNQALVKYQTSGSSPEGKKMFIFLYNVWVYLDVLARLTSDGDDDNETIHAPVSHGPLERTNQIDPLLGCAATLFPLIGRVAGLVQRVRKVEKNSTSIIEQAREIKTQLEGWEAREDHYVKPEDPLLDVAHCINTAEAYRWATLLYLHQAVPELPSPTAHELAKKVMGFLATIPKSSGSCIVHIYPLLAAGCEAVGKKERDWVDNRWQDMCARMWIGNVEKAWEVVREVWDRRDRFEQEQQQSYCWGSGAVSENSGMGPKRRAIIDSERWPRPRRVTKRSSTTDLVREFEEGKMEYEVTVRDKLHWVSVMKDRNWEVLLG